MKIKPALAASLILSAMLLITALFSLLLQPDPERIRVFWQAALAADILLIIGSYLTSRAASIKPAPFLALDERLCRAAELVPRAFRAPETLEARILLGDREYTTPHFLNTPWSTSQGIFVEGALEGAVEVCRRTLEEPDQEERFLREEMDFLRSLAGLLGQTVQREREIRRAEQVRDLAFAGLLLGDPCAGVLLLDPQGRVLEAEFPDRALPEGLRRIQGCRLDEVAPEVAGSLPEASPEAEGVLSLSLGGEEGVRPGRWRRLGRPEAGEPGGFLLRLGVPEAR